MIQPKNLKDDEYPFYDQVEVDPIKRPFEDWNRLTKQGSGSGLDADSLQTILAVTASVAGPNKLVATDNTGKLPASIIP
jgi:hypothetical protein